MHNTSPFEKNMTELAKRYPVLAERVKETGRNEAKYKVIGSKTGEPNVVVARDTDFLALYDRDKPAELCKDYLDRLNIRYAPIVIFLGLGLGYHARLFMRYYGESCDTKKIIIFEEDIALFRMTLEIIDLTYLISHPDIYLFVAEEPSEAAMQIRTKNLIRHDFNSYMRSIKVIPIPSSITLSRDYYFNVLDRVKQATRQQMVLAGNDPIDSFMGLENMLFNLKNIISTPGINLLYNKFKGRPAVTVASGPSLNKNMHLLKELSDRSLIVCCDASFLPLMKRNIRPHIVVSMERTDGTEIFYENVPDFEGIHLAFCPLVKPRTFDSFRGKKIIVNRPFSHFEWLHLDRGMLSFGPSVGNMAYKVAEVLGCDPIIMIGQDLAFAEDGDTHVKGMPFGERDDYYHGNVIEVEGNNGRTIKTCRAWDVFRQYFEEDIQKYPGLCINATEGGARIRGTKVMTFQEAIEAHCRDRFQPEAIIDETLSNFDKDLDVQKEYAAILSRIHATRESLQNLIGRFKDFHDETRTVQRDIVHPFIYNGKKPDSEIMRGIATKFLETLDIYLKDKNIQDIMLHTLQPQLLWFANKFNFLSEIYSDEDCLFSSQILMIKEWLGVIGQLFVSTEDVMGEAEEKFIKDMQERGAVA
ncbi:MAG: motility associated factor glycosyltransferase family protein [Thermodesulfobacteriota bacterium]